MERSLLMDDTEPSDNQLKELMHEVANDAKNKSTIAQLKLEEEIKRLIQLVDKKNG